jgi:hypothetical protein
MRQAWRATALALLLTIGVASSTARAQWGYGAGFRGYAGPNLYEPGFYTAYGYAPPVYSLYPTPRFYLGSPSGNPGFYSGTPYDYRAYNGAYDFNYPASYPEFGGGFSFGAGPGYVGGMTPAARVLTPAAGATASNLPATPRVLRDFGRQPRPSGGATGRIQIFRGPPGSNAAYPSTVPPANAAGNR